MTIIEPARPGSSNLVDRVKSILLTPSSEWGRIDAEPATIQGLYVGYVCILAAIPVLASLIGSLVFGHNLMGVVYRPPIIASVVGAVVGYVLSLVSVLILALVIDALAPSFAGQKSRIQAFKVAAYAQTAGWVVGILAIFPPLAMLGILGGLYGIYLLYLGLPLLMKAPADKAVGYTAVTILVAIVVNLVFALVIGALGIGAMGMGAMGTGRMLHPDTTGQISGTMHLPGGTSVDLAKLQAASQAMQASANQITAAQEGKPAPAGAVTAVPVDAVKALIPASLSGGFDRNEFTADSQSMGGMATSNVEAVYAKGDSRVTLKVTDLAGAGALASLGGALNLQSDKETATGYEKIGKVDGRLTTEKFDHQANSGQYSVVVADRFVVEADGDNVNMDQLKAAVNSVGFDRLEALSKS